MNGWRKFPDAEDIFANEGGEILVNGKLLVPTNAKSYYTFFYKGTTYFIHKVVARCFPEICGRWFKGCQVDHLDTDRHNNKATNLRVCTVKENANNPLTLQHKREAVFSTQNPNHRPVNKYTTDGEYLCTYPTISDAERDLGAKAQKSHISKACQGKLKTCLGYRWSYAS